MALAAGCGILGGSRHRGRAARGARMDGGTLVGMSRMTLADFGKWMYEFDLGDGTRTPVYLDSLKQIHAVRLDMILRFLDAQRFGYGDATVLDIACNEGWFLFELLKRGMRCGLGIEGRQENLAKAEFIKAKLVCSNCEFQLGDVL